METVKTERTTKETSVCAEISFPGTGNVSVSTTVPFFDVSTITTWLKTPESSSVNVWRSSTDKAGRRRVLGKPPFRWMMRQLPF